MGKADILSKLYFREPEKFAELFNVILYDGKPEIDYRKLRDMDTTEILEVPELRVLKQKMRDIRKLASVKVSDNRICYMILGLENQTNMDHGMPIRNMAYDVSSYEEQMRVIVQNQRKNGTRFYLTFPAGKYLTPVITLIVYLGTEQWNAPRSLLEMFAPEIRDRVEKCIGNYHTPFVSPKEMTDEQILGMHTDLKEVFQLMKYSDDYDTFNRIIISNPRYERMDPSAARLICVVTGMKIPMKEKGRKINMCEAVEGIRRDGIRIGEARGIALGEARGMAKKEREAIKTAYELICTLNPEKGKAEIIRLLADGYGKTIQELENIVA